MAIKFILIFLFIFALLFRIQNKNQNKNNIQNILKSGDIVKQVGYNGFESADATTASNVKNSLELLSASCQ